MRSALPGESRLSKIVSGISDLIILNICHALCCLPLITIGAATKALYSVTFVLNTDNEGKISKIYLDAFKKGFKQSTLLWGLVFVLSFASIFNLFFFYAQPAPMHFLFVAFPLLTFLSIMLGSWVFPLISQFDISTKDAIRNSFAFGIGFLPRTFLMVILNSVPMIAALIHPMLFVLLVPAWFIFYFALAAFINAKLMRPLFEKYTPQTKND